MIKRLLNRIFGPPKYSKAVAEMHYHVFIDAAWVVHNVFHNDKEGKYSEEQRRAVREAYAVATQLLKLALPRIAGEKFTPDSVDRIFQAIEHTTFEQFRALTEEKESLCDQDTTQLQTQRVNRRC